MNFRNISAWCIRNPVPPIVLFLGLLLAGIVAFMRMDVTGNPDIDFPAVNVNVSQPGAAPSEIENQITQLKYADIDGDGLNDILVVNNARSKITLLYNRTGIEDGQVWRLWTGNIVHFGWLHFVADTGLWLIIGWFVERAHPCIARVSIPLCALAVMQARWGDV